MAIKVYKTPTKLQINQVKTDTFIFSFRTYKTPLIIGCPVPKKLNINFFYLLIS